MGEVVDAYLRLLPTLTNARGRPYMPRTMAAYAEHLRPFARDCGDVALAELHRDAIGAHLAALRDAGRSLSWVATRDKVIRVWLTWCLDRDYLARSPLAKVKRLTAPDPPVERLSEPEIRRLLAACDRKTWGGVRDAAIILTLWRTGLRVSEACALDLADYDAPRRRLSVRHGKGDKPRICGVPDDAAAALDDWIASARGHDPGPLFPSERDNRLDRRNLALILTRRAKVAGVAGVHPHRLRHTFACDFLQAGGDIETLRRILGHSTLVMTSRYLRAISADEAAEEHVAVLRPERWRR